MRTRCACLIMNARVKSGFFCCCERIRSAAQSLVPMAATAWLEAMRASSESCVRLLRLGRTFCAAGDESESTRV